MQIRFPWEDDPPAASVPAPVELPSPPKQRGRRPTPARRAMTAPAWLRHHLTIGGPAEPVAAFAAAACGSGIIPWRLDYARIEEDVFNLAAAQPAERRSLTIEGCHILARQFRERVEAHQAKAAAMVDHGRTCPLDLHRLLPIPAAILQQGPTHPDALAWLSRHWGTTDRLRQVTRREKPTMGRRLPRGHTVIGYGFFTAGETPHTAITQLGARWPGLRFLLQPRPD